MHSHLLDNYAHLDSPLHRLPVGAKMLAALATIIALVAVPPAWTFFGIVATLLSLAVAVSRVPCGFVLRRLLLLEPFVLGVALLALFGPHGGRTFLLVVSRTPLCILTILLLSNTTPFSEQLLVLRRLRVPMILVTTLALMYRYLFVLSDEAERMKRARASRTLTQRPRRDAWRNLSTVIAQLFVRSTFRAERIYAAMCARGWR